MSQTPQDSLSKPGAGLPRLHTFFLRYIGFPMLRAFISWEWAMRIFESEGRKVLRLAETLNEDQLFTKVLIPKTFGIEDNSRYYSAAMVLWHLTYVGDTIREGIVALSRGEQLDFTVKIENYKPYVDIDTAVLQNYRGFLHRYRDDIEREVEERYTANCHGHPWFGCLNPYGWLVMCALHQWVHRRQLERIVKDLQSPLLHPAR
ncbi:MAG: DinB family protein [Sulfurimonadaceae bacterium]|nr:DinB family protein [Sulfurimonadaceae bacterium]